MQQGYVYIETNDERSGVIRLALTADPPLLPTDEQPPTRRICYVAGFNDGDAALMHAHQLLRHALLDVDAGLYRTSAAEAIAVLESLDLRRERRFLDPALGNEALIWIEQRIDALEARRRRRDKLVYLIGYLALALVLFNGLIGLFG